MLTKKLKRITEFGAIDKILEDGLAGKIKLYTKLKADVHVLRKLIRTLFLRNSHKPLATSHH